MSHYTARNRFSFVSVNRILTRKMHELAETWICCVCNWFHLLELRISCVHFTVCYSFSTLVWREFTPIPCLNLKIPMKWKQTRPKMFPLNYLVFSISKWCSQWVANDSATNLYIKRSIFRCTCRRRPLRGPGMFINVTRIELRFPFIQFESNKIWLCSILRKENSSFIKSEFLPNFIPFGCLCHWRCWSNHHQKLGKSYWLASTMRLRATER